MKTTDLRAKARAIFGSAIAEPMPKQPNGAKALQERANARPIPTYKVGGAVKKPTPPGPTAAEREEARRQNESLRKAKVTKKEGQVIESANRSEGGMYKKGGAAKKDGLAVMIAIGKAKPVKKAIGGKMMAKMGPQARATLDAQMAARPSPAPAKGMLAKAMANPKFKAAMDKAAAGLSAASASMPSRGSGTMNKVMNNPKMRAELEAAAAKAGVPVPVKRAVGGAGKTRKGMMK
jgi:hypothetical protein